MGRVLPAIKSAPLRRFERKPLTWRRKQDSRFSLMRAVDATILSIVLRVIKMNPEV